MPRNTHTLLINSINIETRTRGQIGCAKGWSTWIGFFSCPTHSHRGCQPTFILKKWMAKVIHGPYARPSSPPPPVLLVVCKGKFLLEERFKTFNKNLAKAGYQVSMWYVDEAECGAALRNPYLAGRAIHNTAPDVFKFHTPSKIGFGMPTRGAG
jgi:hypothetical protein